LWRRLIPLNIWLFSVFFIVTLLSIVKFLSVPPITRWEGWRLEAHICFLTVRKVSLSGWTSLRFHNYSCIHSLFYNLWLALLKLKLLFYFWAWRHASSESTTSTVTNIYYLVCKAHNIQPDPGREITQQRHTFQSYYGCILWALENEISVISE